MAVHYLVCLDIESGVGNVYSRDNDGFIRCGDLLHPVLDCNDAIFDARHYAVLNRCKPKQEIRVPHRCVIAVWSYSGKFSPPIDYVPPQSES